MTRANYTDSLRMPINRGIVGSAVVSPFRTLVVHRDVIEIFVRRDVQSRYINSALGLWWAVIQPLALLALFTFVFSGIMKMRLGERDGTGEFALYLFCGLLPWLAFSDAVTRSSSVIVEQTPLIKKVLFPSEILPVHLVLSALVVEAAGLAVFLAAMVALGRPPGWALAALPVVIALQVVFTAGVAWLMAAVAVFLRDTRHVVSLGLTLWLFLTPIMYSDSLVPERYRWILAVNPMAYVVEAYRSALLQNELPAAVPSAIFAGAAFAAFVSGHWVFLRSKRAFADLL